MKGVLYGHYVLVTTMWPREAQQQVAKIVREYGPPRTLTNEYVEWRYVRGWQRIRVRRDGLVEQTVGYIVPERRLGYIRAFAGRLFVDVLHKEVTVVGSSEEENRLVLNLMHDILVGIRTPGQAWERYERCQEALRWHWPDPYLAGLRFHTDVQQFRSGG